MRLRGVIFSVFVCFLLSLAIAVYAQDELIVTPETEWIGTDWPFTMNYAHLHVHSTYSTPAKTGGGRWKASEYDHALAGPPADLIASASKMGIQVLGFSDHGETLDTPAWEEIRQLGERALPEKGLVVLPGFEWTIGGIQEDLKPVEHISVYGTKEYAGTFRRYERSDAVVLPETYELYRWLDTQPGVWFGVFNHPWAGIAPFMNFVNPQKANVLSHMALIEVGGGLDLKKLLSLAAGLPYYDQALEAGWQLAPCIGIDNFANPFHSAKAIQSICTVILTKVADSDRGHILDAILARRTYARVEPWEIRFAAKGRDGRWQPMGSSLEVAADALPKFELMFVGPRPPRPDAIEFRCHIVSVTGTDRRICVLPLAKLAAKDIGKTTRRYQGTFRLALPEGEMAIYLSIYRARQVVAVSAPIWVTVRPAQAVPPSAPAPPPPIVVQPTPEPDPLAGIPFVNRYSFSVRPQSRVRVTIRKDAEWDQAVRLTDAFHHTDGRGRWVEVTLATKVFTGATRQAEVVLENPTARTKGFAVEVFYRHGSFWQRVIFGKKRGDQFLMFEDGDDRDYNDVTLEIRYLP